MTRRDHRPPAAPADSSTLRADASRETMNQTSSTLPIRKRISLCSSVRQTLLEETPREQWSNLQGATSLRRSLWPFEWSTTLHPSPHQRVPPPPAPALSQQKASTPSCLESNTQQNPQLFLARGEACHRD